MLYGETGHVPEDEHYTLPFGNAAIVRPGTDITVIGVSIMVKKALEAAELLSEEGINVEVIDPRTLVPLDIETLIQSVAKTSRVVIAHEAHRRAGPAAEIAAMLAEEAIEYLDGPIVRVGAKNVPLPYSPGLEEFVLPGTEEIIGAIRSLV